MLTSDLSNSSKSGSLFEERYIEYTFEIASMPYWLRWLSALHDGYSSRIYILLPSWLPGCRQFALAPAITPLIRLLPSFRDSHIQRRHFTQEMNTAATVFPPSRKVATVAVTNIGPLFDCLLTVE
jgi:hypothetical protein